DTIRLPDRCQTEADAFRTAANHPTPALFPSPRTSYIRHMALWLPLILAVLWAVVSMRFSVWRTQKMLDAQSRPLRDPALERLTQRMAAALDIPEIRVNVFDVEPVNGLAAPDGRIFLTTGF